MQLKGKTIAIDARYLAKPGMGIYEYVRSVVEILLEEGADITLVGEKPIEKPDHILEQCTYVAIPPKYSFFGIWWEQVTLCSFLRKHSFQYFFAPANQGLPAFYIGNTRLVLNVHDLIPLQFFGLYFRRQPVETLLYLFSIASSIYRAKRILAVSKDTASDIRRRFGRASIATLNPVARMHIVKAPGAHTSRRQFVYNGGRDPRKNVALLLEAFASFYATHQDYKLVLMGKGYEADDPLISKLGIASAVVKTGFVSQEDKMRIVAESIALVYPSMTEGYGLPIVEALSSGVPVICGTGGAQREVAGGAGIFIEPITVETIAARLTEVAAGTLPSNYAAKQKQQLAYLMSSEHEQKIVNAFKDKSL